jgi:IS30 family transposase
MLGRAPSTISREIGRNGGIDHYRASYADRAAWDRAHRPKARKLALHLTLARRVADKLQQQWSPEQIAGWLKRTYPDDPSCQVSHETIYRTLFIQSRGALKKELLAHLRRTRAIRRSRHHTQKTADHGRIGRSPGSARDSHGIPSATATLTGKHSPYAGVEAALEATGSAPLLLSQLERYCYPAPLIELPDACS